MHEATSKSSISSVRDSDDNSDDDVSPPGYEPVESSKGDNTKQWTSKQWTNAILERDTIQISENKLQSRLDEFLLQASPSEVEAYEKSRKNLLSIVKTAQDAYEKRYPNSQNPTVAKKFIEMFKAQCREAAEIAFEFSKILDTIVQQAPTFVSVAYGAIKILLYAEINSQELKSNVHKYMKRIKVTFDMVDHLTVYMPTANLVNAVAQMYGLFNRFLAKAIKLYTRNRLKLYIAAFAKPWRKLEGIVTSIEFTYSKIKDITQFHTAINTSANLSINRQNLATSRSLLALGEGTLAVIKQLSEQVEALSVKISKETDIHEVASLLQQKVEEKLDDPRLDDFQDTVVGSEGTSDEPDYERFLQDVFTELRDFEATNKQRRDAMEELPEMHSHRAMKRNLLKAENIMQWIESKKSQLLWIDGNEILNRGDFNSLFAAPLLILGENSFESVLVLRHFCGDGLTVKTNNYRTLVQSLIFQMWKQRPRLLQPKFANLGKEQTSNLMQLWNFFLECLAEVNADCTFIIINSIDYLHHGEVRNGVSERQIVLRQLEDLVNNRNGNIVKILLTASIAQGKFDASSPEQSTLALPFNSRSTSQRQPSLSIMQNDMSLPQKMIDIQERTERTVSFSSLPMLYPLKSLIYHKASGDNQLRAYIVSELSGMEHRSLNMYSPLLIRVWSVEHNGTYFTKRYTTFPVSQFPGEKPIASLQLVPAGYVPEEAELRKELIFRGRKYWNLGNGIHYKQFIKNGDPIRIIVDLQSSAAFEEIPFQEVEDEFPRLLDSHALKACVLLVCPPKISVYNLRDRTWDKVFVDDISNILFQHDILDQLYINNESNKTRILDLVKSCTTNKMQRSLLLERDYNVTGHDGNGVVLLIHGDPGTGKTFTATSVAETIQCPILTIASTRDTSSVLTASSKPEDLEQFLSRQFHFAQRWGAIVVLEHAEQFLGKKNPENTFVTLRIMDRFSGALILTTHARLSEFDSAVQSRLTQHFHFYAMTDEFKEQLWGRLFQGLKAEQPDLDIPELVKFAGDNNFKMATRTGRDIQNSFMAAKRLSEQEKTTLSKEHLEYILTPRQNYVATLQHM
ncbi:hypothetical protein BGW36DRAFT_423200 [Talaromyces proteolyticus]|uniref:AAA+ ATPase domain-containing protein n=1 Tax=Talaromyces proteolyticus TaxID=1131652 RepID=A0AAD4L4Y1_9EURO|nr:uncharacterized protein BGW36DRAFT_423200 [Talaromyces proteolyticus]KAH8703647.1 hypothetical protein BGW36DRAFT_423200 [Talaromyces proteolyticus]